MEKKLTDEEIIKAWDICYNSPCCTNECPYFNKSGRNLCVENKALYKDMKQIVQEHAKQKAEIERLTEYNANLNGMCLEFIDKNAELQKQVDELKEKLEKAYETERANIRAEIADAGTSCHWCERQTVKDIFKEIFESCVFSFKGSEDYKKGFCDALEQYDKQLRDLAKLKGVEVE